MLSIVCNRLAIFPALPIAFENDVFKFAGIKVPAENLSRRINSDRVILSGTDLAWV